jgi:hypothetical protein
MQQERVVVMTASWKQCCCPAACCWLQGKDWEMVVVLVEERVAWGRVVRQGLRVVGEEEDMGGPGVVMVMA